MTLLQYLSLTASPQRHYDELFPALPDPSPATMAASALYLAQRDLAHYSSLGQASAWTDSKLAGFRLAASAGDRGRYWKSIELGAAAKKGDEAAAATSTTVQVGPAASGQENAFDVRFGKEEGSVLFSDVIATTEAGMAGSPNATTVNAHLAEHLARVDIIPPAPNALASGALPTGETLHVFNTAEQYAGAVEVKVPSWMSNVGTAGKAAGAQSGGGGAKAPMRASMISVRSRRYAADPAFRPSSLQDRSGLRARRPVGRGGRAASCRRGDEDREHLPFRPGSVRSHARTLRNTCFGLRRQESSRRSRSRRETWFRRARSWSPSRRRPNHKHHSRHCKRSSNSISRSFAIDSGPNLAAHPEQASMSSSGGSPPPAAFCACSPVPRSPSPPTTPC